VGIADPRDLEPEAFATPIPAAAAVPQQTNRLYLPMARFDPSASGTAHPDDAVGAQHLYLPFSSATP
jgi:hypothetical protein